MKMGARRNDAGWLTGGSTLCRQLRPSSRWKHGNHLSPYSLFAPWGFNIYLKYFLFIYLLILFWVGGGVPSWTANGPRAYSTLGPHKHWGVLGTYACVPTNRTGCPKELKPKLLELCVNCTCERAAAMMWNWWSQRIFHKPSASTVWLMSCWSCWSDAFSWAAASAETNIFTGVTTYWNYSTLPANYPLLFVRYPLPDSQLLLIAVPFTGMPIGSHKNHGTTFCGKPVCMYHTYNAPQGPRQKPQKGLRERNMSLYNVRNYLFRFKWILKLATPNKFFYYL